MNFRVKCALKTIVGKLPASDRLDYLVQKYLSRSMPPRPQALEKKYKQAVRYHEIYRKYGTTAPDKAVVYEIGCGWHLAMAFGFSTLGYGRIIALDVSEHVKPEIINKTISYISETHLSGSAPQLVNEKNLRDVLWDSYRIALKVPCDSTQTGLEDQSVDFIYSHNVFEHIPPELIPQIMDECYRVLKDDGIISFLIDYSDHYITFDKSITPYNFLRYDDKQWRKYNPPLHYVNRLRHSDFVHMFRQAGFEIVEETPNRPQNWENMVKNFPFADSFRERYSMETLSITSARFVLKKSVGCERS
ncbi:MAG: methyltransferase domain-containing protein [Butyrivibrio sp.]|nr:methyltransferase domain-containing protein [Muribaculum sp.]MCM1552396.1 methyltransferase domain-containing protein [Butyrivibrio sp.]